MSRSALVVGAALAVAMGLAAAPGAAQELRGVAVNAYGEPLAGIVVALHRVGDTGPGANVASVTTDDDGRFHFQVDERDSALYFAAMRHDGAMYIGPAAMAGVERVTGYTLTAVPEAEAGAVATALAGGGVGQAMPGAPPRAGPAAPGASAGADMGLLAVGFLALASAALFMMTAPRYRRRRTRDAVLELATVEEALAGGPGEVERKELLRRRHDLRDKLAPPD